MADDITCRDTTWLVSDSRERPLTDSERAALIRHVGGCRLCQAASVQFEVLFRQIDGYFGRKPRDAKFGPDP